MSMDLHSGKASPRRRKPVESGKQRHKVSAFAIALAVVGLLGVGGTLAFLVATTGPVENAFTVARVSTEIEETFDGSGKSDVFVENKSDVSVYIRAQVLINWVDKSGNIVAEVPSNYTYTVGDMPATSGWVKGANDVFYYKLPVPAGGHTTNLVDSVVSNVTLSGGETQEYFLSVEVLTEAIQADGLTSTDKPAVTDAWGASVNTDKSLDVG